MDDIYYWWQDSSRHDESSYFEPSLHDLSDLDIDKTVEPCDVE